MTPRSCSTGLGVSGLKAGTLVRSLSVAEQQIVEIAKAVSFDAKVIQMDEPTAALADHEVELLYSIIRRLTDRGVAIVYVSHRLQARSSTLCTTITILKDGQHVATRPAAELSEGELVRLMVGRPLTTYFPRQARRRRRRRRAARAVRRRQRLRRRRDLDVRAGEIVGIAGLQGSGRTELLEAVFGVHPVSPRLDHARRLAASGRSPRQGVRAPPRLHHRGPQGQGPRPQPVDPRQRPRRGPRGLPASHRCRAGATCRGCCPTSTSPPTA